jgi:hypothetical protein
MLKVEKLSLVLYSSSVLGPGSSGLLLNLTLIHKVLVEVVLVGQAEGDALCAFGEIELVVVI